jgi:KaiC/GvpD/RAD55 family RecA-like ATPase
LTDGIILQRYLELDGTLRNVMVVAKMRGFDHEKELAIAAGTTRCLAVTSGVLI